METTSLIDKNDSSESLVEATSNDEGVGFIRNQSYVSNACHNDMSAGMVAMTINHNKGTSDVPPLADASDSEETQSQTSMSSSIYTIKETSDKSEEQKSELNNSPQKNDINDKSKPWDEDSAQISVENEAQKSSCVFLGISVDSTSSVNTVQTSNKDVDCSSASMETSTLTSFEVELRSPQQQVKRDEDQLQNPIEKSDREPVDSTMSDSYRESVLEKYVTYVTEFFSCYASSANEIGLAHRCADMCNCTNFSQSKSRSKTDDNSEFESQLQVLQTCIENDILTLMGCSAEGAQSWIDSIGDSLFCAQCQCSRENSGDRMAPYSHTQMSENDEKPKIRNRSVYLRQKAHDRIRRLRQSGLSRDFSLSPVYDFKREEDHIDSNPFLVSIGSSKLNKQSPQRQTKENKNEIGHLIPLSKRPRAIGDGTRQTSLNAESTVSYDSVLLATRSDEASTCEEDYGNSNREPQSDARKSYMVAKRPNLFTGFFNKSDRHNNDPDFNEDASSDLYYDSDPGTRHRNIDASELRKTVVIEHSHRSRTLGAVSDIAADLRRLESDSLATKMSLIQSLDVNSFDVNDSQATSQLISVGICDFRFD